MPQLDKSVGELFSSPDRWTTGTYARDENGKTTRYNTPSASCWCLRGAILRCYGSRQEGLRVLKAIDTLLRMRYGVGIVAWNDNPRRTYGDIVELVTLTGL